MFGVVWLSLAMGCRPEFAPTPTSGLRMRLIDLAKKEAKQGDGSAHCYLGWVYATGSGTLKDVKLGVQHLNTAAESDRPLATRILQVLPEEDEETRLDQLVAEIRSGAVAGDTDAQFILATWVAFGHGLSANPKEAMRQMRIAAENGNNFAGKAAKIMAE